MKETLNTVLVQICVQFGAETLKNGNQTCALISDLAPQLVRERTLLKNVYAMAADPMAAYIDALTGSGDRDRAVYVLRRKLEDSFMAEEAIGMVIDGLGRAVTGDGQSGSHPVRQPQSMPQPLQSMPSLQAPQSSQPVRKQPLGGSVQRADVRKTEPMASDYWLEELPGLAGLSENELLKKAVQYALEPLAESVSFIQPATADAVGMSDCPDAREAFLDTLEEEEKKWLESWATQPPQAWLLPFSQEKLRLIVKAEDGFRIWLFIGEDALVGGCRVLDDSLFEKYHFLPRGNVGRNLYFRMPFQEPEMKIDLNGRELSEKFLCIPEVKMKRISCNELWDFCGDTPEYHVFQDILDHMMRLYSWAGQIMKCWRTETGQGEIRRTGAARGKISSRAAGVYDVRGKMADLLSRNGFSQKEILKVLVQDTMARYALEVRFPDAEGIGKIASLLRQEKKGLISRSATIRAEEILLLYQARGMGKASKDVSVALTADGMAGLHGKETFWFSFPEVRRMQCRFGKNVIRLVMKNGKEEEYRFQEKGDDRLGTVSDFCYGLADLYNQARNLLWKK